MEGSEASAARLDRGKHAEHIEVLTHVHGTRTNIYGDPSGMANLSAEEPYALMRARTGLWEPWRVTARATRSNARLRNAIVHLPLRLVRRWTTKNRNAAAVRCNGRFAGGLFATQLNRIPSVN